MNQIQDSQLSSGLEELATVGVPDDQANVLADFIRTSSDLDLFRIDPLRFGRDHDITQGEAIDLFLHATVAGLFQMEWNIVCASCGNVFKSFRTLERVDPHFHCTLCDMENPSRLDDIIQVVFTVDPELRRIVFHDPSQLTLEQLLFEYHYSQTARTSTGHGLTVDLLREATVVLRYLEPGESVETTVELLEGSLLVRDWTTSFSFFVGRDEPRADRSYLLTIGEEGLQHEGIPSSAVPIDTPVGTLALPAVHALGPGTIHLTVVNAAADRRSLWVVKYPAFFLTGVLGTVEGSGSLTARQLLNSATFRRLFRWEAPGSEEGLSVTDLTYLFTDLKGSTSMYDEIGDATAYNLVRAHFGVIEDSVTTHQGVIVKTIGDAVMATFLNPADAVASAVAMVGAIGSIAVPGQRRLGLKVGIHRGHSIAVTLNERLDYFGQNVNIAARTQQNAGPNEILVTSEVMNAPGVAEVLGDLEVTDLVSEMPGVSEDITIFRVTAEG